MKHLFLGCLFAVLLFGSCNIAAANGGIYQYTNDFAQAVRENRLDIAYQQESRGATNTIEYGELEKKYLALWDDELNAIYKKVLAKLSGAEKEKLIDAQAAWLDWHLKESAFVSKTWLEERKLGTQGPIQELKAEKIRLRERTLELMDYYCLLGGSPEFQYK